MIVFCTIALLFILYLLSLQGRTGMPGMEELKKWKYAHRGLHNAERPENSMAAFRAALEHGYGIEFDLHLLKDGNLAILHDSNMERMTGCKGIVEDLTTDQLKNYHLNGTEQTIPEFRQLLELYNGKAPLIIELKSYGRNAYALTETACKMLEGYTGPYCIESFDPYVVYWLRKNRPDLIRGQLAYNSLHDSNSPFPIYLRFITTYLLENFLTRPDFVAYEYGSRKNPSVFFCRKLWRLVGVSWTLKTREMHDTAVQEGWLPIFERFIP